MERLDRLRDIFEQADRRQTQRRKHDRILMTAVVVYVTVSTAVVAAQGIVIAWQFSTAGF